MFTKGLTILENPLLYGFPRQERMVKMTVNQIRDYTALVKRYMNIKSELIERGTPALRSELKEVYEECMNMRSMMGLDTP